jgi:hypothetical protein
MILIFHLFHRDKILFLDEFDTCENFSKERKLDNVGKVSASLLRE